MRGPVWDGLWILNALWLAPLAWFLARGLEDPERGPLDGLYLLLTALFWVGHRISSTWLAYFTTAYRPLLRAQPVRFVVMPALVAATLFVLLLPPDDALPFTRSERVMGLVILDYLLVTYHFAAQHFGVLSLYRSRAGRVASRAERRADRLFALGVGGLAIVVAEALRGDVFFQDVWVDPWLDPGWLSSAEDRVRVAATAVLVLAVVAMLVREARTPRPSVARALYAVGLGGMATLAVLAEQPFLFLFLWTVQHWLVAVGLATLVARGEPEPGRGGLVRWIHGVNRRPLLLVAVLAVLSVLLLPVMEVEAIDEGAVAYGDRLFPAFARALRESSWVPALIALGFTTAFCHYLLDRAVYRFSDPDVRRAAAGLTKGRSA